LVSRHPAQELKNRTTAEMERVICRQDPPSLSGELGSIAQMAMHKEPQRRYATVEQLSEDVRRYIEGLPVLARKDTVLYRTGKFLRRNRWSTLAAAVAVLGLVIGIVVATVQSRRSERRFQYARRFADLVLSEVALRLQHTPGTLNIQQKLIPATLQYLDGMAKDVGPDRALLVDLSRAYYSVAKVQYALDGPHLFEPEAALDSARNAWSILEPLLATDPGNVEVQAHMRMIGNHIGWCLSGLGRDAEALQWYERIQRLGQVVGTRATAFGYPANMAGAQRLSLALGMMHVGRLREALDIFDDAIRRELSERKGRPNTPARAWKAEVLVGVGDLHGAESLLEDLVKQPAWRESFLIRLASLEGNPLTLNRGRREAALRNMREAINQLELRVSTASEPDDLVAKAALAYGYATMGALFRETAPEQSIAAYFRAIPIQEALLGRSPNNLNVRRSLANAHAEIALPLRKLARIEDARLHLNKAVEIERAVGEPQAFTHMEWGDLLLARLDRNGAREQFETALALAEKAVAARPEPMQLRRELADCYERLGEFHAGAREWKQARNWYAKSLDLWNNWTQWGVSSVYDQRRRKEALLAVTRYGRLLSINSPE
jgi:tetratricopeptide (TPR) repeat protein